MVISAILHTAIYNHLYNALIWLLSVIPHADVGVAVILLTVAVKLILFPLAKQASKTNIIIRKITPDVERIKEEHKDDPQAQAAKTMELYRENGIHPLSGFLVMLIQIPIIIALYWIFIHGGLPDVNESLLYPFVHAPANLSMEFLGVLNLSGRSIILAVIAGVSQFLHARLTVPVAKKKEDGEKSFQSDMARSLNIQMRYMMPVLIMIIAYTTSAAVGLYFATSNIFMFVQEVIVRRMHKEYLS